MQSARRNVALTMALSDNDHVRDVVSGVVGVQGVDLTCLTFEVEEIFFRFTRHREWDVSELSMGKFCALKSRGDESVVGIPVFPSRAFRHSGFYVRPDGPRDDPAALRGGRIGIPEWTVTATVYGRDLLVSEYGVGLDEVEWVQGGTEEPGRIETLGVPLPDGVRVTPERERSLSQLLLAGEIDAILAPHPPAACEDGSGQIARLFTDTQAVERAYFAKTGIFPIMHVIALRGEVHREHPWIARNLLTAFETAKDRALRRATEINAPRGPIPWSDVWARSVLDEFGGDPWPYGIEPNRTTLNAFTRMCHDQRVAERRLAPEELFVPEVADGFRV